MPDRPGFVAGSTLLTEAYEFACEAHGGSSNADHPTSVARNLSDAGFGETVVAAGFLHDVVEDTELGFDDIGARFGSDVRRLVEVMTEDPSIEPYEARKAEHRRRVLDAGDDTASIYAADKLARVRRYSSDGGAVAPARLTHYRATLALFRASGRDLAFLGEIESELAGLRPDATGDFQGEPG